MLAKCTNPSCSAQFHYLHQGKLFRWETGGTIGDRNSSFGADPEIKAVPRRIEYFWLCEACATSMTLAFDRRAGVIVRQVRREEISREEVSRDRDFMMTGASAAPQRISHSLSSSGL